ncbi:MAG: response regulator transcription factor [Gammaproteobacteria bacterium]
MNTANLTGQARLILVDDNAFFLQNTSLLLSEHKWLQVVGCAAHGAGCLALVAEQKPDVVVVDLAMPGMNGFQVTQHIKAQPNPPLVIILSLYDSLEYRERGRLAGADGYVSKAMAATDLVPLLHSLLKAAGN